MNCWRELVLKPTQPSSVGSIEGSSVLRGGRSVGGRPISECMRSA